MTTQWLDMLSAEGIGGSSAGDLLEELDGYVTSLNAQLSDLSDHSIYEITGADATAFLQGQFCNDVSLVSATQAQITGYCTPKGRLLALPTILGFDDGYRMLVPNDVAAAFIKRLSMFVMRSDVVIRELEDWVAVGITAPLSGELGQAQSGMGALPVGVLSVASGENMQLIRWHDDHSGAQARARYIRLAPASDQIEWWQGSDDVNKCSSSTWRLADVSAGIPSIRQGVVETFVPQMMNLQLINALSFTKGCYPGQEIVARMQYLGKLKRHMRVFKLVSDDVAAAFGESLTPGKPLTAGSDENAGIVVDGVALSSSAALVLAVTKVTANEEGFSIAGASLEALDMSYELPSLEVA